MDRIDERVLKVTPAAARQSLRRVYFRHRLIACKLRVMFLSSGSFHPLGFAILNAISKEPMMLPVIADAIGMDGRPGNRVTAEILHHLVRAGLVNRLDESFLAADRFDEHFIRDEAVIEEYVFLPRSNMLRSPLGIRGKWKTELPKKPCFVFPNEDQLPPSITDDVLEACASFHSGRKAWQASERVGLVRDEVLQRTGLLTISSRYHGAAFVSGPTLLDRWMQHRCYLYRNVTLQSKEWTFYVCPEANAKKDEAYTRFIQEFSNTRPDILKGIVSTSKPL